MESGDARATRTTIDNLTSSNYNLKAQIAPRPLSGACARGTSPVTIGRFLRRLRCRLQLGERGLERRGQHAEAAAARRALDLVRARARVRVRVRARVRLGLGVRVRG